MSEIVLLDRFFDQIHSHLVNCYDQSPHWPIIFGIFGRSGDGKSAQLTESLDRCHVEAIRINAADLESGLAGEPGKHIARTYATASLAVAKNIPAALIVDDVDTTVGEWAMNTGTVNHQQVLAELMHLADQPVDKTRNFPRRVPVFVTGNNLARLYPPLRRHGRMISFVWRPEPHELRAVIEGVLGSMADVKTLDKLAGIYSNEPISFFVQLRRELQQIEVPNKLRLAGYDMKSFLSRTGGNGHSRNNPSPARQDLMLVAARIQAAQRAALTDFLQEESR